MVYVKKRSQSYSCCILEQIQWENKQFLHKGIGDWALGILNIFIKIHPNAIFSKPLGVANRKLIAQVYLSRLKILPSHLQMTFAISLGIYSKAVIATGARSKFILL